MHCTALLTLQMSSWMHLSSRNGDLPAPNTGAQQTASLVLDIDKNGIDDFVIAERSQAPSLVWFRRSGSTWIRYIIEPAQLPIEAGGTYHDIDADGDLDIVMGADWQSNYVWWWENPYPAFDTATGWTRRVIKNSGANKHHDQIFGDFNGDGKAELVFWNQYASTLFLAEIPTDPRTTSPWSLTPIFTYSGNECEGLAAFDVDNDGKLDIIGGGRWFRHVSGTTFAVEVIDEAQRFTRAAAGQLKRGGRPEIVFVPGDADGRMVLYEWNGSSWIGTDLIGADVIHGHSLHIADIDNDGHLDIFNAEMRLNGSNPNAKMRLFFGNGMGMLTLQELATGYGNHESRLGDFDGDGDLDILTKPYNWDAPRIDLWLQNGTGSTVPPYTLTLWTRHVIDENKPWTSLFIAAADMDNDGKKDIVTGGWWYRNPGIAVGNWTRLTIGAPLNNMATVYDFDNDGAVDVLGTQGQGAQANPNFVWARNNGSGGFTILNNVASGEGDFLQGVQTARFKPGDPLEVALSWHESGRGIQFLTVPENPSTTAWSWRRASTTSQDEQITAVDLETNGTMDLILGTQWLRFDGTTWTAHVLNPASGLPDRNRVADINRDGKIDVVVGFESASAPSKLAWYEQPLSPSGTWPERVISSTVIAPMSLDVADMDHDGDFDVVVGEHNLNDPANARLLIFENSMGDGSQWAVHTVFTGDEHHDGAIVVDMDNDGDLDIISIGWNNPRVLWYENRAIVKAQLPVPVQLVDFRGERTARGVQLRWTTLSEMNNFGFFVQRRRADSPTFSDRPNSFVPGHGTTLEPHHYTFLDTTQEVSPLFYRLRQVDLDGTIHYSDAILIDGVTSVAQADEPREYALHQNTPNPFNPSTRISYELPNATRVVIEVFNVLGQRVATLVDAAHGAGRFDVVFDGNALSSGVYVYRMKTEERTMTRKMLLTR